MCPEKCVLVPFHQVDLVGLPYVRDDSQSLRQNKRDLPGLLPPAFGSLCDEPTDVPLTGITCGFLIPPSLVYHSQIPSLDVSSTGQIAMD